jgi:hypothetical protein
MVGGARFGGRQARVFDDKGGIRRRAGTGAAMSPVTR